VSSTGQAQIGLKQSKSFDKNAGTSKILQNQSQLSMNNMSVNLESAGSHHNTFYANLSNSKQN
jgi:hypothetical protein